MIIESLDVLKAQQQLDLLRMYEQLTLPLDFDTLNIPTTERQEMNHEHIWNDPTKLTDFDNNGNEYPVVAECYCGEAVLNVTEKK